MSKIIKAKCVASYVLKDGIFNKVLHDLRESMKDVTVEGARSENKAIAFYEFQIDGEKTSSFQYSFDSNCGVIL